MLEIADRIFELAFWGGDLMYPPEEKLALKQGEAL